MPGAASSHETAPANRLTLYFSAFYALGLDSLYNLCTHSTGDRDPSLFTNCVSISISSPCYDERLQQ